MPVHIILEETAEKLDCIEIKFLPPNTTAFLQPCDAGIISSFKCKYRTLFIQNRIRAYDGIQDGTSKVLVDYTIYDALMNAWSDVSLQTIRNCWRKTGIVPEETVIERYGTNIGRYSEANKINIIFSFLVTITTRKKLWKCCSKNANLSVNEYIHIEDENNCHTDEDVIELVNREEEMSSEGEAETVEKLETISNRVASISIDTVLYQQ